MAFSESFGLGNSTFMNLESEANKALETNNKNPTNINGAPKRNGNPLDIIDESPTNSKGKQNKSRSRHQVTQFSAQRRRRFQKSKSDSMLGDKTSARVGASKYASNDNYSEFFKSEFSIEEQQSVKDQPSLVSTSQIEAAFDSIRGQDQQNGADQVHFGFEDSKIFSETIGDIKTQFSESVYEDDIPEALDVPVFSEDLQSLMNDSSPAVDVSFSMQDLSGDNWKESLKFSEFQEDDQCQEERRTKDENMVEEVFHLDDNASILLSEFQDYNKSQGERRTEEELDVPEEILNIDDGTFICLDEEGKNLAEMTMNEIKADVQHALEVEDNNASVRKTHSAMERSSNKLSSVLPYTPVCGGLPENIEKPSTTTAVQTSSEPYKIKRDLEKLKRISAWNLPLSVLKEYEKKGISKMFDWQIECLSNPKVLFEHCNLVYSAPTSAGKTLVSEILLIKTILERGKKIIIILPFISVVREKMFYLQDLLTPSGYRVEGFFGGYTPPGGFDSINVAICTIEKANSIINKLLEQGKLDEIGTVVVDEIHLISDPGRGYILELLLAKVLYMSRKYALQIQIITMSATLANVELLKKWLDAELYITNYRPVALQEMIKIGKKIYDNNLEFLREINTSDFTVVNDSDHVAQLCIETLADGCSVVVFCPSKDWCENLSVQLAGAIHTIGRSGSEIGNRLRANIKRDAIEEVKKQLKDIPTGLDSVLEKTINFACAYHHAGLTTEERDIIEACFKSGALKIIVATSTLSSGVNLPARRVIIRSPLFGGKQMSSLTYKQMIGRAGRTGKDTLGESILICTDSNARIGKDLVRAALNPITSCLEMESSTHLKRALLEVISSSVATTKSDILNFVKCTLLNTQKEIAEMEKNDGSQENANQCFIFNSIDFLVEYEFIRLQHDEEKDEDNYVATRLGMACLASSMPPTDGLILFSELQKSRRCFVLESELHAVYLVTPYSVCYQLQDLDWLMYLDLWERLSPAMKKVGELVGVKESFLVRAMRGQTKLDYKLMQIHKRFYIALALQELVNETPVNTVAAKYKCTRGMLQSLQQMASTFAGIVTAFCNSLNWSMLALIVGQFKDRLFFGVHRDLIDLMRLPDLNYKRARALFDGGIQNLIDLANADAFTIEKILHNSLSFDTAKQLDNEDEYEKNQRNNMRNLYITGKAGLTVKDAAKMLVDDARQFVQYEIGVGNINWSQTGGKDGVADESVSSLHMSCESGSSKRKSNVNASDASPPKMRKNAEVEMYIPTERGNSNAVNESPIQRPKVVDSMNRKNNKEAGQVDSMNLVKKPMTSIGVLQEVDSKDFVRENAQSSDAIQRPNNVNTRNMVIENVKSAVGENVERAEKIDSKISLKGNTNTANGYKIQPSRGSPKKLEPKSERLVTNVRAASGNKISNPAQADKNQIQRTKDNNARNLNDGPIHSNGKGSYQQERHDNERRGLASPNDVKPIYHTKDLKCSPSKLAANCIIQRHENQYEKPTVNSVNNDLIQQPKSIGLNKTPSKSNRKCDVRRGNNVPLNKQNGKEETNSNSIPARASKDNKTPIDYSNGVQNTGNIKLGGENQNKQSEIADTMHNLAHVRPPQGKDNQSKDVLENKRKAKPSKESPHGCIAKHQNDNAMQHDTESHKNTLSNVRVDNIKANNIIPTKSFPKPQERKSNASPSPRRSPRNHLPSSTRIEKAYISEKPIPTSTLPDNDLFMDDTSFEMNSEIANAMGEAKDNPPPAIRRSLNKSSDEIAASQEMTFQPKTQSTRYLRSYKDQTNNNTPPRRTPIRRKTERDTTPAPVPDKAPPAPLQPPTNKSSTMEVSDISLGNSLMQNPIQLNASHILSTSKTEPDALSLKSIQIVDICGSQMLFKNAMKEMTEANVLGFSVGVEKQSNQQKPLIGANLLINQVGEKENGSATLAKDFLVDDSTYVAGISLVMSENVSFFLNLQKENTGKGVMREMKIDAVRKLVEKREMILQIFDSKEQLKVLRKVIPCIERILCKIEDPKVANWLLQPDKAMSFTNMAQQFAPECKGLVKLTGSGRGYNSIGMDSSSAIFGKIRSSIEACVTMHILKGQVENLQRIGTGQLHKFFIDLEMPLQLSLCEMESYGFPSNEAALRRLFQQMMDAMKKLEMKIYETHGSKFNLGSGSAVARVVGLHRKANGRVSTSKQILEKIDSPIAQMIISYRKLSMTVTKTIQPLLRSTVDDRIRGQSITFTSTGRISMQEPNLQNVAKDFDVPIGATEKINISCRSSFFPSQGRCLVSADFCQLEMRILAHLSQDPPLLQVMNSERDVFTAIAAKWNRIAEDAVSEQLRNGTKQICYGIVYGMGMRSLAESLKCSEQEAMTLSEQFHNAYPGIRLYTEKVIKFARQNEYVETITGRRRYLENIISGEPQLKSQAERQAVNSTIQGSAADIAKSAILRMEKNIAKYQEKMGITSNCVKLVLHLHDELIFEVPEEKAKKVAKVLSITMENCVRLSVPLKVKLKIGKSWGCLKEVRL